MYIVLDIGIYDGALFRKLIRLYQRGVGVDPLLKSVVNEENYILYPGFFLGALPKTKNLKFDCITILAVLEQPPLDKQAKLANDCFSLKRKNGRIIITVPSPQIDSILSGLL